MVHIFSFIITAYLRKSTRIKTLGTKQCAAELSPWIVSPVFPYLTKNPPPQFILVIAATMYGLPYPFLQTYRLGKNPVDGGRISSSSKKNAHFPYQKNPPHQIAIFMLSPNTSFIYSCSHCCYIIFFNFRLYVQIYHANFDYLMVTESYLQHDRGTEWSKFLQAKFPTPFSTFQCYLEIPASIIAFFPFYSLPFSFQTL